MAAHVLNGQERSIRGINRFLIGALGGFAAWLSKLLALDAATLGQLVEHQLWVQAAELKVSIFVILPVLVFLGALVAWLTEESMRMKLFAIGVSAPAIIAPWTAKSVLPEVAMIEQFGFVQPAIAQSGAAPTNSGVGEGLKFLFGFTPAPNPATQRYWVIVGSHRDLDEAFAGAKAVNNRDPRLNAFVGNRAPDNPFFPVIVGGPGGFLPLKEARKLKAYVDSLGVAKGGSYLSAFADRLPANGVPR